MVPIGTLFVIPYTGGTIGKLPECEVYLDDVNISKKHAQFQYNNDEKSFTIIDLGSRNGTFIFSERLSASKEVSEEYILNHDSRLQVGGITLICHVHSGLETCDGCEPGLIIQASKEPNYVVAREDVEKARKRELRKIRKKFGLERIDGEQVTLKSGYQDRAEVRRQTVGVDHVGAKIEQASTEVPIAKKNKGFQMLAKMGWSEGKSLGKTESTTAITEPISVDMRTGREGLGAEAMPSIQTDPSRKRRADVLEKTRKRYSQLE